jgi:hypothetical protein
MILPGTNLVKFNSDPNKNFFSGSFHKKNADLTYDPMVGGYAFILWTKVPTWLTATGNSGAGFSNFAQFTQRNFRAFGGLSSIELSTAAHTQGFAANEYHVAQSITKANTDFTLRHTEFSGSPVKNMYQAWVTGIRDPETGIATYPKKFGVAYGAQNHTGELLYIVTRPDADNIGQGIIEFSAYYTNVMPTRIPLDHLNFELGSHEIPEIEIPFKGTLHLSQKVDTFAAGKLASLYQFQVENEFDPNP